MVKLSSVLFPALLAVCLCACAGHRTKVEDLVTQEGTRNEPETVIPKNVLLDYRGKAGGAALPPWVRAYLREGTAGIEAMSAYSGFYVFVNENHGPAAAPLEHWLRNFNITRAFPRVAAARLRFRFIRGLTGNVDDTYGGYYESAVKAAFNAQFKEQKLEATYWLFEKSAETGEENSSVSEFRYLAFMLIPKEAFETQIKEMLDSIKVTATKDQTAEFARLRDAFFEGF